MNRTLAEAGPELRANAMADPTARAIGATSAAHRLTFTSRGRTWSAILTINR